MREGDLRTLTESHMGHRTLNAGHPSLKLGKKHALTWWLQHSRSHVSFQVKSVVHTVPAAPAELRLLLALSPPAP